MTTASSATTGGRKFGNTNYGDTIFGRGRVTRKYVDERPGSCLVYVDAHMENIRGFLTNVAPMTIELVSREQIYEQRMPKNPAPVSIDRNPRGLKPGDRVVVKPRPDWEMPTPYRLAGETATVYAMFEVPGYVVRGDSTTTDRARSPCPRGLCHREPREGLCSPRSLQRLTGWSSTSTALNSPSRSPGKNTYRDQTRWGCVKSGSGGRI